MPSQVSACLMSALTMTLWYLESSAKYNHIRECLGGTNVLIKTKLDFLF